MTGTPDKDTTDMVPGRPRGTPSLRASTTLAIALSLLCAWLGLWWTPLVTGDVLYARDLTLLAGPLKLYGAERFAAGELPLWSPVAAGGVPYLADPANQALYPLNVLLLLAPDPATGNTWFAMAHSAVALVAFYLLLTTVVQRRAVAVWGSVIYASSGYVLSITDNMTFLPATAWVPLGLYGILFAKGPNGPRRQLRGAALTAVSASAMLFAGDALNAALLYFTLLLLIAADSFRPAAGKTATGEYAALKPRFIILAGLATLGLAAVQILPTLELLAASARTPGLSPDEGLTWSFPPARTLELLHPLLFGSHYPVFDFLASNIYAETSPWVSSVYLGMLSLPFALYAAVSGQLGARRWLAIALFALILSFGQHLPFALSLYTEIPFVNTQRYPEKLLFFVTVGAVVAAAIGADALLNRTRAPWPSNRFLRTGLSLFILVAVVGSAYVPVSALIGEVAWRESAAWSLVTLTNVTHVGAVLLHAGLAGLILVGALWVGRHWRVYCAVAMGIAAADLLWIHHTQLPTGPTSLLTGPIRAASVLTERSNQPVRIYYDTTTPRDNVMFADGRLSRLVTTALHGSNNVYQDGYAHLYRAAFFRERLTTAVGIPADITYLNGEFLPLEPETNKVWENRLWQRGGEHANEALARAGVEYVVTAIAPANLALANAMFDEIYRDPDVNLRILAVHDPAPPFRVEWLAPSKTRDAPGRVISVDTQPERLVIEAEALSPHAVLTTTVSHAPGWTATIGDREVPLILSDGRFLQVALPTGRSTVKLTYAPTYLTLGFALTTLTALTLMVVLGVTTRTRRNA